MAIQQIIGYNSKNRYFAGFLQELIKESGIVANVSQKDKEIVLVMDDRDEKTLARFSLLTTKYLPHSIFLGDIKTVGENIEITPSNFTSPTYNISLCPKCLENISNPSSENYLDDTIMCHHYSNSEEKEYKDTTIFSPHYKDGDTLLVVEPKNIYNLFVMTEDEIKALYSIEKPTLKVTIKDETLKELIGKKFINIKSVYNVRSTLVALNAKDSEVPYLFFEDANDIKVVVIQKNITMIKETKGLQQSLEELSNEPDINRFLNIKNEAGFSKNAIGANLSLEHGISFMVCHELGAKKVLMFQPFVLSEILEQMHSDETKSKLLVNFENRYPDIINEMNLNETYGLFETLASILELKNRSYQESTAFEALSDKSLEFHGNGGLKIDTFFTDKGFDYLSFIGSIMSFKLAATDDHYLAYSIFEALGDMVIATCNQLKIKYNIENFVMMGNMFENSVIYSRILSKFQLSNPHFSKVFALDD
ncbi:MAG: hydrogenase [Sulfurimonas sp.]|jgi:hypothetical protein